MKLFTLLSIVLVLFLASHASAAINNEAYQILLDILQDWPILRTAPPKPWTESSLLTACDTSTSVSYITQCNGNGWVTRLIFTAMLGNLGPASASVGNMTSLKYLEFFGTGLSGPLPASWGQLINLQKLEISSNPNLTGGIPPEWQGMTNVTSLAMTFNTAMRISLSTVTPWMNSKWIRLLSLYLHETGVTGSFPDAIADHPSMSSITIGRVDTSIFSSSFPSRFATNPVISNIHFYSAGLHGNLPSDWSGASSLQNLNVADNQLTGPIPTSLINEFIKKRAMYLFINQNHFDLCADASSINATALFDIHIECKADNQTPPPCGCGSIWNRCLYTPMNDTGCPPQPIATNNTPDNVPSTASPPLAFSFPLLLLTAILIAFVTY